MQQTIIALRGKPNSGKTSSIRAAYDRLVRSKACICICESRTPREVRAILVIDGVKVGFFSLGDVADLLKAGLAELIEAGCIVIVCATRKGGRKRGSLSLTEKVVMRREPAHKVVWVDKEQTRSNLQGHNQRTAQVIIRRVKKAVQTA